MIMGGDNGLTTRSWAPRQQLAELLSKRLFEGVVPGVLLVAVVASFAAKIPNYLGVDSLQIIARQFGEFGFICLAMALSLISGAIDLSVGAVFALANFAALYLLNVLNWPVWISLPLVLAGAMFLGSINGFLVGVLRSRAFLTTIGTLMIFRAVYNLLIFSYAPDIAFGTVDSSVWDFIGAGTVLGFPTDLVALILVAVVMHIVLTRSRPGWHLTAVGAGRLAARHAGLHVRATIVAAYIATSCLAGLGGVFYAARFSSAGSDAGAGSEILAVTGVILGGVSLGGGRGSIGRALVGALVVLLLHDGLIRTGAVGGVTQFLSGSLLLLAVGVDVKWRKNLGRIIAKIYLDPARLVLPPMPDVRLGAPGPYALNYDLRGIYSIGFQGRDYVGQEDYILDDREMRLNGPEDAAIDREGRVYVGTSTGLVLRFSGANFGDREVYAAIGGQVRGLAFDERGALYACVAGMGLYAVAPDRSVRKLTDETNRTRLRLRDDSRLTTPCDLTVLPDGRIAFTENSFRYDMGSFLAEAMELRANGRIVIFDPKNGRTKTLVNRLVFPTGICAAPDGKSFLYSEMWLCRISRYWLEGPRAGSVETVVDGLPGYAANINSAADGGYWVAIMAMRTPIFDLIASMPRFRYGLVRRLPTDEWPLPNLNCGGALHLDRDGKPTRTLWDPPGRGQAYSAVTSAREAGGYLYLAGMFNNRIGRVVLDRDRASWRSPNRLPVEMRRERRVAAE
jgi:ribose transport system permease protein